MRRHRKPRLLYRLALMSSFAAICAAGVALVAPAVVPAAPAHRALAAPATTHSKAHGRAPVEAVFWNGDWSQHEYPLFQRIIDRFNKSHPGIHVKMLPNSFIDTKLLAAITAG